MRYTHAARSIPRGPWQDFARLLTDALSAEGISADDLDSWKGALRVFVNGIAPKN
uniref:Globin family profile domain-containing protein n=1 Tax=Daphnia galeata TaxID=27404 RepID=A0A8J2RV15_9CRUS|nr:unnamed protein product [Daphnia galeata]